jgi:hypothetical protein
MRPLLMADAVASILGIQVSVGQQADADILLAVPGPSIVVDSPDFRPLRGPCNLRELALPAIAI